MGQATDWTAFVRWAYFICGRNVVPSLKCFSQIQKVEYKAVRFRFCLFIIVLTSIPTIEFGTHIDRHYIVARNTKPKFTEHARTFRD